MTDSIVMPEVNLHADRRRHSDPGYDPRLFRVWLENFQMLCRDASAQEPVSGTDDRGPYIRLHWTSADDRNGEAFTETRIVGTPLSHYPRRFEHHIRYTLSGRTIDLGPLLVPEVVVDQIDVLVADIPDEIQALEILAYRVTERIAMQAPPF